MKMEAALDLCVTEEVIEKYASIECTDFGQVLLEAMGYNAVCILFCKCSSGGYNIGWGLENGEEYIKRFFVNELLEALKGKTLYLTMEVRKDG